MLIKIRVHVPSLAFTGEFINMQLFCSKLWLGSWKMMVFLDFGEQGEIWHCIQQWKMMNMRQVSPWQIHCVKLYRAFKFVHPTHVIILHVKNGRQQSLDWIGLVHEAKRTLQEFNMPQISRIKLFVCLSLLRALLLFFPEAKRLCCVNSSKRGCKGQCSGQNEL